MCVFFHQAGRLLIRKLVCEKMGFAWDGFRLERTVRGKPYLPRPSSGPSITHWNFNLSHQGDYAVLAAEPGRQVGVDVMKTSRPGKFWSRTTQLFCMKWQQITSYQNLLSIKKKQYTANNYSFHDNDQLTQHYPLLTHLNIYNPIQEALQFHQWPPGVALYLCSEESRLGE